MRRFALFLSAALVAASAPVLVPTASSAQAPGAGSIAEPASVPNELLVGYRQGASGSERASARAEVGARLVERVVVAGGGGGEVELVALPTGATSEAAIRRFERNPSVAYAEPNWIVTAEVVSDDPHVTDGSLWGMSAGSPDANQYGSQAVAAWAADNVGSSDVVVGVIDTGVDIGHGDLAPNIWANEAEVNGEVGVDDDENGHVDDVNGWDFYRGDASVYDAADGDSHGTHVAGTIAAVGGNQIGVAGVAWNAKVIPLKFLGPNGGSTDDAVKAIDYLTALKNKGVNVVASNNSWGGGGYSQALFDAIERARTAGILFIAAAGNGGSDQIGDDNDKTPRYPSSYTNPNIISVASLTAKGALSTFSNYGDVTVDLAAPGSSILSTIPGGRYGYKSGTSMATPHVTGGVVLAAASGTFGAAALKARILDQANSTPSLLEKTVTGGRLDVSTFAQPGGTVNLEPMAVADSYAVTLGQTLKVEAPGVLKNDTDPEGATLNAELFSAPESGDFTLNPNGGFVYTPASTGTYTFTYLANDGTNYSTHATVTITVKAATTTKTKGGGGGGKPSGKGHSTK